VLRRWRDADREPFAAMNADPEVMRYFPRLLTRDESDAAVERFEAAFDEHGFGLWAVEVPEVAPFIGFVGIDRVGFEGHFTPAVEIGWRLAAEHWNRGYATEAAAEVVRFAFGPAGLDGLVSFTAIPNEPSRAVMRRLGMTHDPADDFDHPRVEEGSPLRRHVLYRLGSPAHRGRPAG
jgi:ribosomal-protein-alanine N-acetyltransferase